MSDETVVSPAEHLPDEDAVNPQRHTANDCFRHMMDRNFLDYASYVIGSRAIPDVDDGLKPVQRRILWTLYQAYDNGRTTKTANIVGNAMHYHPHGDASIGDAIVVLANKGGCSEELVYDPHLRKKRLTNVSHPYFLKTQGNFGHILTGARAAASRYTECSISELARETLFNNDITELVPNYDGRKLEPVVLPAKVPSLLMLGSDGIAVGMSTTVLPHNFNELIDAEIAVLKGEDFQLFPDFQQGGVMDVRKYEDGNGKITLRAKIDIEGRDLIIREIPATCNTATLVESIERAQKKNKIKIASVDDYTTDHVEIKITPTRGYDPEKTRQGLYMYTDCAVSISPKLVVICDHKPVQMTVSQVLKRNVDKLLSYLKREFEIDLERQSELRHAKTLAQLFFENRIYKRIEECRDQESEYNEVFAGLEPFRSQLKRDVTRDDVDKLLALPVRRIARFDIEKNQRELREIAEKIKEIKYNLAHLTEYTISYLEGIKAKYGPLFPRHTEIEDFEQIDRKQAALNNIKIGWNRKDGYIGSAVKSDDTLVCNEFDRFICMEKTGSYKIIPLPPEKLFVGKLYDFRKYAETNEFGVIYRDKKTGKYYGKRSSIGGHTLNKDYAMCPENCQLELFTPRPDAIYRLTEAAAKGSKESEINLMTLPLRNPKARGILLTDRKISKITHLRYLEPDELLMYQTQTEEHSAENSPQAEAEAPDENDAVENIADRLSPELDKADSVATKKIVPEAECAVGTDAADRTVPDDASEKSDSSIPPEKVSFRKEELMINDSDSENGSDSLLTVAPETPSVEKKTAKMVKKSKTVKKNESAPAIVVSDAEDENFGIVQPEFGF